jgi:LacI family transcriptional regulator
VNPEPKPPTRKKPADIRTVAQRAGVSIATVSRTVNQVPTVNRKIAKRVWEAISELGYLPNTQARGLVCGRSGFLGLIVPKARNPFIMDLLHSFEEVVSTSGYSVVISFTVPAQVSLSIRRMIEHRVEALSILISGDRPVSTSDLESIAIPYVCIDGHKTSSRGYTLHIDYFKGIREGVQNLAALGHRKIGFASTAGNMFSTQSAVHGFYRALAECGIDVEPSWVVLEEDGRDIGRRVLEKLFSVEPMPTAVICCSLSAAGVMEAASKLAWSIPEDLSVIVFGDHLPSMRLTPASIVVSSLEVAQAVFDSIRGRLPSNDVSDRRIRIQPRLIVGSSTGFPRGAMKDLKVKSGEFQNDEVFAEKVEVHFVA